MEESQTETFALNIKDRKEREMDRTSQELTIFLLDEQTAELLEVSSLRYLDRSVVVFSGRNFCCPKQRR